MHLQQIDVTGARLVGAITKELGMDGPKHHAIVLGKDVFNGEIYVTELMSHGHQVATYSDFHRRYAANGEIRLEPNRGPHSNAKVAQQALAEVQQGDAS